RVKNSGMGRLRPSPGLPITRIDRRPFNRPWRKFVRLDFLPKLFGYRGSRREKWSIIWLDADSFLGALARKSAGESAYPRATGQAGRFITPTVSRCEHFNFRRPIRSNRPGSFGKVRNGYSSLPRIGFVRNGRLVTGASFWTI